MYTDYSKVLNYFRGIALRSPNTDARDIVYNFCKIKERPDDLAAARYLISAYQDYQILTNGANVHVSK